MVLSVKASVLTVRAPGGRLTGGDQKHYPLSFAVLKNRNSACLVTRCRQTGRIGAREVRALPDLVLWRLGVGGRCCVTWPRARDGRGKMRALVKVTAEHTGVSALSPD